MKMDFGSRVTHDAAEVYMIWFSRGIYSTLLTTLAWHSEQVGVFGDGGGANLGPSRVLGSPSGNGRRFYGSVCGHRPC